MVSIAIIVMIISVVDATLVKNVAKQTDGATTATTAVIALKQFAIAETDALIVLTSVPAVQRNAVTAPVIYVPTAVIAKAVSVMTAGAITVTFAEIV